MDIEIVPVKETLDMLFRTLNHCWGVKSKMNLTRLFACSDSILEIPEYYLFATAPRSVAMQLETHKKKHGIYVWLESARPDLATAKTDKPYSRDSEINFVMKLTARGIKDMCHYRMCKKAEAPTREFLSLLKEEFANIQPELVPEMVPLCVYRGGICTEFNSCK